jgi:hypothetical protein
VNPKVLWQGRVRIEEVDGKTQVIYQADGAQAPSTFVPNGFMEKKAVGGLVDRLKNGG